MSSQYKLRGYQEEAVKRGVFGLTKYKKPFILCLSVGAGKSLVIADICHKLDDNVLIICPNKEILEQNYQKLLSYGIDDISMYSASVNKKDIAKYTYATIGSIYKKPELFQHFKYVCIDEADLVNPKRMSSMYMTFLKAIGNPPVCGLTATPYRLVQGFYVDKVKGQTFTGQIRMLNRIKPFYFRNILYYKGMSSLINEGYLTKIRYIVSDTSWSSLKLNASGTNFTDSSLEIDARKPDRVVKIISAVLDCEQNGDKSLTFCPTREQAKIIYDKLVAHGISAGYIDGDLPKKQRELVLLEYKSGAIQHMINVDVLSVGFDEPSISAIILARPSFSVRWMYQAVGRGVRIDPNNPDKILKVYDIVGLTSRFGKIENIRLGKEIDGFRDRLESDKGTLTNKALWEFSPDMVKVSKKWDNLI